MKTRYEWAAYCDKIEKVPEFYALGPIIYVIDKETNILYTGKMGEAGDRLTDDVKYFVEG